MLTFIYLFRTAKYIDATMATTLSLNLAVYLCIFDCGIIRTSNSEYWVISSDHVVCVVINLVSLASDFLYLLYSLPI